MINTVICDCVIYSVVWFPIFYFYLNLLKPAGCLTHMTGLTFKNFEFSHTVYLCVLYLSENKQGLFPYIT